MIGGRARRRIAIEPYLTDHENIMSAAGSVRLVCLLQPICEGGERAMPDHGVFYWNELLTRDVAAAKAFYTDVLGWETEEMPMPTPS